MQTEQQAYETGGGGGCKWGTLQPLLGQALSNFPTWAQQPENEVTCFGSYNIKRHVLLPKRPIKQPNKLSAGRGGLSQELKHKSTFTSCRGGYGNQCLAYSGCQPVVASATSAPSINPLMIKSSERHCDLVHYIFLAHHTSWSMM